MVDEVVPETKRSPLSVSYALSVPVKSLKSTVSPFGLLGDPAGRIYFSIINSSIDTLFGSGWPRPQRLYTHTWAYYNIFTICGQIVFHVKL